MSIPAIC